MPSPWFVGRRYSEDATRYDPALTAEIVAWKDLDSAAARAEVERIVDRCDNGDVQNGDPLLEVFGIREYPLRAGLVPPYPDHSFSAFLADECEIGREASIREDELLAGYLLWMEQRGILVPQSLSPLEKSSIRADTRRTMRKEMKDLFHWKVMEGGIVYYGLAASNPVETRS